MQYFGGKGRICGPLAEYINGRLKPNQIYWEPFCGSCWVMGKVDKNRVRIATDLHPDLIEMWQSLQSGWIPPEIISEEEYVQLKLGTVSALRGFAGFGCSNSGKWFGGYARDGKGRNYARNAQRSLTKKVVNLADVRFECGGYDQFQFGSGMLIYCDPPYRGTTGYATGKFDHMGFWQWVRERSKDNVVLVSEYGAPDDFGCVWELGVKTDMKMATGLKEHRVERLFEIVCN